MQNLATNLRATRKAKGLTQGQLGQKMGIPQSHVSKIEGGRSDARASSLIEMARLLDLEVMLVPKKYVPAVLSMTMHDLDGSQRADYVLPAYQPDQDDEQSL